MQPINLFDYEALASNLLEPAVRDYYQGGSDDEITIRECRAAYERIRLRPRVLVDVSTIDMSTTALGTPISMPILVAPTAAQGMAHPEGECATVRGVGQAETIATISTTSSRSIEDIAASATGPLWLQLYTRKNLNASKDLVQQAEALGYRAIAFTVDVPRLGRRERDLRNNFNIGGTPLANYTATDITDPTRHRVDTWETVDWLKSVTNLPILLKGILTAEDAMIAIEHKVAGIIVSNHGGRQLDSTIPSIEALPEIVEAVAGRCEVYVDGGIRRGTDVLKALALGARAVLVGRPTIWGLTVNGAEGVHHMLELLREEFELAMTLCGCPDLVSINRSLVRT